MSIQSKSSPNIFTINIYQNTEEEIEKYNINKYSAECVEYPIILGGHTIKEIKKKMYHAIIGYFKTFPEDKGKKYTRLKYLLDDRNLIKKIKIKIDNL